MTAPQDRNADDPRAGDVPTETGWSPPLAGYDAATAYQYPTGYPSGPVQYPATGQFGTSGLPPQYAAAPYDPAVHGAPPYGQPYGGYGSPYPMGAAPRNGIGTAALVLGIIGVVLSWTALGVILGVLAVIFGGVGLGRARRGQATNRGAAMAGLVLGIVAVALLVLLVIVGISLFAAGSSFG